MAATLICPPLWALFLLAAVGAALAGEDGPAAGSCGPVEGATVAVAAAVDGDTLHLADGRMIHVAGIEAVKAASDDVPSAPLAQAALAEIARLTGGGVVLAAPAPAAPDRYGRLHADVRLADGRSAAEALVAVGLARVRLFPHERTCLAALFAAEARARAARRGQWALPDFAVRRADDPSLLARSGLYELVEGQIAAVGHGKLMVFLDFGRDYRRDFTIGVPTAMVDQLPLPVDAFTGRRVRVRGVIEESGGPAIRLGDPDEIELLDEK
jgi:endonuclease YncB( thermonuclease family)